MGLFGPNGMHVTTALPSRRLSEEKDSRRRSRDHPRFLFDEQQPFLDDRRSFAVDALPIRMFWYSEPAFSAGVELVRIDEVSLRIYSAAKTVADCFKYRNKIGLDVAVEALRRFQELKKKTDFRELVRYARICRAERIMRPYLEATL